MSTFVLVVIRGEIERRQYNAKVESKGKVARERSDELLVAVVQIQSGKSYLHGISLVMKPNIDLHVFVIAAIRGWLARRDLIKLQNSKILNVDKRKAGKRTEVKVFCDKDSHQSLLVVLMPHFFLFS